MRPNKPQSKSQQDELHNLLTELSAFILDNPDDLKAVYGKQKETTQAIQSLLDRAVLSGRIEALEEVLAVGQEFDKGFNGTVAYNCLINRIAELTAHLERKI